MANNENVDQNNQGAPAADIPDLKKKEKERKKAGAGWGAPKGGAGSFSGATGGTVARAAASAASASGGAAVAEAAGASWLSSMIASLTATVLGKAILAAGIAAFLMGAGLFGYAMLKGGGAAGGAGGDLGAIASSMKVHTEGGDRTGYVASNGEIMFDPLKKTEAKKEAEKAPEDKAAGEAVPPAQTADASGKGADFNRPGLEHNMSGSKLSSSMGGGFGGKNIFAGNSGAPKLNEGLSKMNIQGGSKGRLSASNKSTTTGRTIQGGKSKSMKANKAFGQLKVAKGMSALGANATGSEAQRSSAASAFDGVQSGGNVEGSPTAPAGAVSTPGGGGGAPDMTAPGVTDPNGVDVGKYNTDAINAIGDLAKKAGEMKKKAEMMMIAGVALVAVGIALMCSGWPWCLAIGAIILAIGAMLIGMSIMMSQMAQQMKDMADQMSNQLAAKTKDINQDATNKYCIEKAYNDGTDPKSCNPPDSVTEGKKFDHDDQKEVKQHGAMVKETSHVEGENGKPTGGGGL